MSAPYFPLYVSDFEADTSHLTLEEDGAYNRLLRLMWLTPGCSLPDDAAWIIRRMRIDEATFERVIQPLLEEFFARKNGRIYSPRLTRERGKLDETSRRRSEAGKMGGRPKAIENTQNERKPGLSKRKARPKQPEPEPEPDSDKEKDLLSKVQKTPSAQVMYHLSAVLPADVARAFVDHRKALKKPMTPRAAQLIAGKLDRAKGEGRDPVAVVELSIIKGWQDVFPQHVEPKNGHALPSGRTAEQEAEILLREAAAYERDGKIGMARIRRDEARRLTGRLQ